MQLTITPTRNVGGISFGMDRNNVRRILPGFQKEFKKSKFSKSSTDDFGYCHVFYNTEDRCNAVEFFEGVELIYNNSNLFELSIDGLKKVFPDLCLEYGSYISRRYSIGIVINNNKVESILVGCQNYYC